MYNFRFLSAFICFLTVTIFIQSCKKLDPQPVTILSGEKKVAQPGEIMVTADNQTKSASASAVISNNTTISISTSLYPEVLNLYVNAAVTGTYTLGSGYLNYITYNAGGYTYSTSNSYGSGTIVITEIDAVNKTMTGTFQFTGYDSYYGNEKQVFGSFTKIPYTQSTFTNSFSAYVNYYSWTPTTIAAVKGSQIVVTATKTSSGASIKLYIPTTAVAGSSYSLNYYTSSYTASYNSGYYEDFVYSGNIYISSHNTTNKTIVGTFYFTTDYYSDNISSGSFSVMY